jgi:hypothetical protein
MADRLGLVGPRQAGGRVPVEDRSAALDLVRDRARNVASGPPLMTMTMRKKRNKPRTTTKTDCQMVFGDRGTDCGA